MSLVRSTISWSVLLFAGIGSYQILEKLLHRAETTEKKETLTTEPTPPPDDQVEQEQEEANFFFDLFNDTVFLFLPAIAFLVLIGYVVFRSQSTARNSCSKTSMEAAFTRHNSKTIQHKHQTGEMSKPEIRVQPIPLIETARNEKEKSEEEKAEKKLKKMENLAEETKKKINALEYLSNGEDHLLHRENLAGDFLSTITESDEERQGSRALMQNRSPCQTCEDKYAQVTETGWSLSDIFQTAYSQLAPEAHGDVLAVPYVMSPEAKRQVDWFREFLDEQKWNSKDKNEVSTSNGGKGQGKKQHADYELCEECEKKLKEEVAGSESEREDGRGEDSSIRNTRELIFYLIGWKEPENAKDRKAFDLLLEERRSKVGWSRCLVCTRDTTEEEYECRHSQQPALGIIHIFYHHHNEILGYEGPKALNLSLRLKLPMPNLYFIQFEM